MQSPATWVRWPTAQATLHPVVTETLIDGEWQRREDFGLALRRGRNPGRAYALAAHAAAWRSYGEAAVGCGALITERDVAGFEFERSPLAPRLQAFARAYGPMQLRDGDAEAFGRGMLQFAARLRDLAGYWDDGERGGVSYPRSANAAPLSARNARFWLQAVLSGDRPIPSGTLHEFLAVSALEHVQADMPMRRCAACSHWIALTRADRTCCDTNCRMALRRSAGRQRRGRYFSNGET